jgi:ABC-type molybdate transport system permease subunit
MLPALRGGLFSGTLLTFSHSLGEFGATVMVSGNLRLRTQTAPLYIFAQFEAGNIETANAVAAVLALSLICPLLYPAARHPAVARGKQSDVHRPDQPLQALWR